MFQSSKKNYWKSFAIIRNKSYNTVSIIDNTLGDAAIVDIFKDKYATLYNSVSSSSNSMKALHERIRVKITSQCDTCVNPSLHTHSVSIKAVNHLKNDKYNDDSILMSNNFLHGTHLLYTCIAQLFSAMLCYGFAPRLCLRSTMIPIPKGGRSSSSNSDHFRSIAISSILSKILDYIIIQGRMQDFSGGGAQLKKIWDFGYTCREAACREQRSCEPLLGGFGGMPPQENFFKWCNFVGFEGYFQPLS